MEKPKTRFIKERKIVTTLTVLAVVSLLIVLFQLPKVNAQIDTIGSTATNTGLGAACKASIIHPSHSGTLQSIGVDMANIQAGVSQVCVALYTSSGWSNIGTLINGEVSSQQAAVTGWQDLTVPSYSLSSSNYYGLAVEVSGSPNNAYCASTGNNYTFYYLQTFGTFQTSPSWSSAIGVVLNMRITYSTSTAYTANPTKTFSLTKTMSAAWSTTITPTKAFSFGKSISDLWYANVNPTKALALTEGVSMLWHSNIAPTKTFSLSKGFSMAWTAHINPSKTWIFSIGSSFVSDANYKIKPSYAFSLGKTANLLTVFHIAPSKAFSFGKSFGGLATYQINPLKAFTFSSASFFSTGWTASVNPSKVFMFSSGSLFSTHWAASINPSYPFIFGKGVSELWSAQASLSKAFTFSPGSFFGTQWNALVDPSYSFTFGLNGGVSVSSTSTSTQGVFTGNVLLVIAFFVAMFLSMLLLGLKRKGDNK